MKLLWICYLWCDMVINAFVLLDNFEAIINTSIDNTIVVNKKQVK